MICDPKGRVSNETEVAPVNTYFTDEILEIENFLGASDRRSGRLL